MNEFPKIEKKQDKIIIHRKNGTRIISIERAEKRLQRSKEIVAKFEAVLKVE